MREFQLRYRVAFRVHDGKGGEFLPASTVQLTRDITFNDTDVLAKETEEQLLYRDMQIDMVQQIMRRLAAAQRPKPSRRRCTCSCAPSSSTAHLAKTLAPLYLIHGDEPLLALEAADAVRAAARKRGYTEREVLIAERGFDWSELAHAGASQSLFGEPQDHRAAHAHRQARRRGRRRRSPRYCARPEPGHAARWSRCRGLEGRAGQSALVQRARRAGVVVEV